ncbi:MAG TPA: DUF305 domain-containing protein [Gemmatimonadales bacterium]|nr:DUF305 domain-containing protein [Gemmatimonadales bacterium]
MTRRSCGAAGPFRGSRLRPTVAAALLLVLPGVACAQHPAGAAGAHGHAAIPEDATFTAADVAFMQGMIAHHAQAIHMSRMAATHEADPRLGRLASKIAQSQVAEIRIMQDWLLRNGQVAPDTSSWRTMHMDGMLTAAQLEALDGAAGPAFDRAFLTLMIQHHEGALQMVEALFAVRGAGQDVDVSVFANDVVSVQTAEIGAMRRMLSQLPDR